MFARLTRVRPVVTAWILGATLTLIAVATALADGGTSYPH